MIIVCYSLPRTIIIDSFIHKQSYIHKYSSFGNSEHQLGQCILRKAPNIPHSFPHERFENLTDEDELWLKILLSTQTWSKDACSCQNPWNDSQLCGWCGHKHKITQKEPKSSGSDGALRATIKVPPFDSRWDDPDEMWGVVCVAVNQQTEWGQQQTGFPHFQRYNDDGVSTWKIQRSVCLCEQTFFPVCGIHFGIYMVCSVVS